MPIDTADEARAYLVEHEYATEEECALVADINGHDLSTYEDILFVRAGYRSFDQLEEE